MGVFKNEVETKRVIFNVRMDLAERLEAAKDNARAVEKKLDVDTAVNKALERYLKKAEKKLAEMTGKHHGHRDEPEGEEGGAAQEADKITATGGRKPDDGQGG